MPEIHPGISFGPSSKRLPEARVSKAADESATRRYKSRLFVSPREKRARAFRFEIESSSSRNFLIKPRTRYSKQTKHPTYFSTISGS